MTPLSQMLLRIFTDFIICIFIKNIIKINRLSAAEQPGPTNNISNHSICILYFYVVILTFVSNSTGMRSQNCLVEKGKCFLYDNQNNNNNNIGITTCPKFR